MFTSFNQAVKFIISNGISEEFKPRIIAIKNEAHQQNWFNKKEFDVVVEHFQY